MVFARCASNRCFRLVEFEIQVSNPVTCSTWHNRRNNSIPDISIVIVLKIKLRLFYISITIVLERQASNRCFILVAFEIQDSNPVAYSTWHNRRNTSIPDLSIVIVLKIKLQLLENSITMVFARCASNRCFCLVEFEIQDSNPAAYSTWHNRRNTSIPDLSIVIVLKIKLRLFYISITMVLSKCASNRGFRSAAFEIQDSNPVAYSTWHNTRNTSIPDFSIRQASNRCFRLVAFEFQDSNPVAYSTCHDRRNTSIPDLDSVIVLKIKLQQFCNSITMALTRCASNRCFRLAALEIQDSNPVAYSTWHNRRNTSIPDISIITVLKIKLWQFYISITMVLSGCASSRCFRLVAFEIQDSNPVLYSTWHNRRNTSIPDISIAIVLKIKLQLFCNSITMALTRCASNRCFRLAALEIQDSNPVAYSTWHNRRNTSIPDISIIIVLKIKLWQFYISITMVLSRCASSRCFILVAFEIQDSNPVAYSTWHNRRNTSIPDISIIIVLKIKLWQFYISITMVLSRCASSRCFILVAFEIQDSNPVAYSTWHNRRNTSIPDLSIVIVLKIKLQLLYNSITMVFARCASSRCFCLVEFEIQDSNPVTCSTWHSRRNTSIPGLSIVIVLKIKLRLFYISITMVLSRCASNRCFCLVEFEIQDSNPVTCSTWHSRRNTSIPGLSIVIVLKIKLRLFYISITMVLSRCAPNRCFRLVEFEIQDSNPVTCSTWHNRRNTSIPGLSIVIVLKIKLRLFYISISMVLSRCASNRCFRLAAFEIQDSNPVAYYTWYISRNTSIPD
ncbi:hypothetical protein ANTQUA_LOCUS3483 [Anthophora quadrimaculata]